ncbi:MAG TPA: DUF4350 domain-containing protein [Pyrinomonadaceae bacterium]|jgi:hypothetical protein|nr:DUF4350 domain-containing protein [Pyrinomonadaceae bacterium]
MKRQFFVVIFLVVLILVLAGVNAISYTKIEQKPDSEYNPNRSSYNSGATGTSAFYSLLAETKNKVVRWQQPPSALHASANSKIRTFVIVGEPRRFVSDEEAETLLRWVRKGGRLVLIDRFPHPSLIETENKWKLTAVSGAGSSELYIDQSNPASLIDGITAAKPVQPTTLMKGIIAVQPSKLASTIKITYSDKEDYPPDVPPRATPKKSKFAGQPSANKTQSSPSSSPPPILSSSSTPPPSGSGKSTIKIATADDVSDDDYVIPTAPVILLANQETDILADYPYGDGHIFFLTDPFIVSNAGIKLVDNATLAINMVAVSDGTIAFDEYHQGYGSENTFLRYFAGTPVPALLGQAALLIFVLVWTRGKRFARPLPAAVKDRRSKLEYVAAMADLQRSTRAYDLAIENVYTRTRREMIRLVSADNTIQRKQLAQAVAERAKLDAKSLYLLMAKCEDIIHGEPTTARETMNLITELRTLEEKLGLHRKRTAGPRK